MKITEREKTAQAILQMLNGLKYSEAKEILDKVHDQALESLKVILSEDEQEPFGKRTDIRQ